MPVISSKVEDLLGALEDKVSFRDITKLLKSNDMGTAIGWKQLLQKFDSGTVAQNDAMELVLRKLQSDLVLAGSKEVHIFPVDQSDLSEIEHAFIQISEPVGDFADRYPLPLQASSLAGKSRELILAHKSVAPDGDVTLVFCALRAEMDRRAYGMNEVTAAVRESFAGYDSFIALKKKNYQIFDVVTFRKSLRRIEVLIDYPERLREKEKGIDRCIALLGILSTSTNALLETYNRDEPINLFPAMHAIYSTATEGKVKKLAFRVPSKSMKRETVASDDDLRNEDFHAAGKEKVGEITVFDITVFWEKMFNVEGSGALRLSVPVGSISSAGSYIRSAHITDARSDDAIKILVNKLVSYSTV